MSNGRYLMAFACVLLMPSLALAQAASTSSGPAYPAKPVRMIIPFPPGGPTDLMGRMAADRLTRAWGMQVIADNRPGAGGNIGIEMCAKSPPDGYTICMMPVAQAMSTGIYRKLGFDPIRDLSHVTLMAILPSLLTTHPSLPVKNVKDLIALAKRKPGALNYASSGGGASHHLAMEMLKQQGGVDIVLVTYKGGGAQLADQLAGRVELAFNLAVGVIPHVKNGKLRALAVSTKQHFPALPEVPSVDESGLRGFDATSWQGLSMPAGVPRDVVRRISADAARFLKTPEAAAKLLDMGGVAVGSAPEEFDAFFKAESDKWVRVAKTANIKLD